MLSNEVQKFLNDLINPTPSICLVHQLPETSTSMIGNVCECCKKELYTNMPAGRPMIYWESQPVAYTLDKQPLFPITIRWESHVIQSLHPNPDHISHRYFPAHLIQEEDPTFEEEDLFEGYEGFE